MKDDTSEGRRRVRLPRHLPRLALVICLALIVVTLGMVVRPGNPPEPPQPSQSDRARAAALADALDLRSAGERLAATGAGASPAAGSDASRSAVEGTVSLLTTQARALLRPGQVAASPASTGSGASASAAASAATASASAGAQATPAALAAGLAASGRQRLADAATADGGTARLLAVIGTGQLLQATSLAAAAGAPDPSAALPGTAASPAAASATAAACPAGSPSSEASAGSSSQAAETSGQSGGQSGAPTAAATRHADLPNALAAVISTERENVYGYQVALTRLDGSGASTAAAHLTRHESLAAAAEAQARLHCEPVPPREAGYALDPSFLASPAAGLAALETGSLAPYADLVALSDGTTRHWALSGLLEAARRAVQWGAKPGPMPGLAADPDAFPTLPAG